MVALTSAGMQVQIIAPAHRQNTTWIGGSMIGSLSTFGKMWITKGEYDEYSPFSIHWKYFRTLSFLDPGEVKNRALLSALSLRIE